MSAIVAGKACKSCSQEYYISFGHPSWYPVKMSGKIKSLTPEEKKKFDFFQKFASSGLCVNCYIIQNKEFLGRQYSEEEISNAMEG